MRTLCLLVLILTASCKDSNSQNKPIVDKEPTEDYSDVPLEVYDFEGLKPLLKTSTDKVYVVNFWATWCAPCIKELPYFEALGAAYSDRNVELLLVSLDFPKKYESHLKPFIKKNNLKSKVVALDDNDSNTWIPAIDPDWTGAIPATLIFNKNKRQFYEQTFTYEELETEVKQFLN
ncbi:TlpA family protein disulfide reductase [Gelidibacter maritimus]|uniref:TlpA family protein disulfide reductase n=1 Tax=Gelidibacter maritimus TaxID=2761487 RepID=A0A7W2M7N4_9FLAO|nr:TlpA disulfide reductase family protein [Gelidibacter maritimus]MBA6154011.1 TlpA family protein disulfide reductase [Gelidibacter maritimus]